MAEHEDGGAAFNPQGMTLLEWYAGMALATIDVPGITVEEAANLAFDLADAMIVRGRR